MIRTMITAEHVHALTLADVVMIYRESARGGGGTYYATSMHAETAKTRARYGSQRFNVSDETVSSVLARVQRSAFKIARTADGHDMVTFANAKTRYAVYLV
jgi:hypothetical protein